MIGFLGTVGTEKTKFFQGNTTDIWTMTVLLSDHNIHYNCNYVKHTTILSLGSEVSQIYIGIYIGIYAGLNTICIFPSGVSYF